MSWKYLLGSSVHLIAKNTLSSKWFPLTRYFPRGRHWRYDTQRFAGTRDFNVLFDVGANVGLGPLDDADLRGEAGSWNCFINPLFCLSRGCSTKLATALSWEIPVVTTSFGRRGYVWNDGTLSLAERPAEFWRCILEGDVRAEYAARRGMPASQPGIS